MIKSSVVLFTKQGLTLRYEHMESLSTNIPIKPQSHDRVLTNLYSRIWLLDQYKIFTKLWSTFGCQTNVAGYNQMWFSFLSLCGECQFNQNWIINIMCFTFDKMQSLMYIQWSLHCYYRQLISFMVFKGIERLLGSYFC